MITSILPSNSTDLERALEQASAVDDILSPAIEAMHGLKYRRPLNASVAPWLVSEYGLGPISEYFTGAAHQTALNAGADQLVTLDSQQLVVVGPTTIEDLIDQGRAWQRKRGTRTAIKQALLWIDYDEITIWDQVKGRRRWHLYQIDMGRLPLPDESTLLASAERLADLSDRARSFFWRGFYGYDVRGLSWGRSKWGRSIWGDASGVKIGSGKPKWSHGRQHAGEIKATDNEQISLDVVYDDGDALKWSQDMTWSAPGVTWAGVVDAKALKAWLMLRKTAYVGFYDTLDNLIGYAPVVVGGKDLSSSDAEDTVIRYAVRTDFGTGFGSIAATVSLVFGGQPKTGVKPGRRWFLGSEIAFPAGRVRVGALAMAITFQQTIREFVTIDLRLPPVDAVSEGYALLTDESGVTLTTSDEDGLDDLSVPSAGAIPQGGAILTDSRGDAVVTGPLSPLDVLYGPKA